MARKHSHNDPVRPSQLHEHLRTAHGMQAPFLAGRTDEALREIHDAAHGKDS